MRTKFIAVLLLSFLFTGFLHADEWFKLYEDGVEAIEKGDYNLAVEKLQQCLQVKKRDTKRIRTYGMHFIEYFPHRELGIAYFNLGLKGRALKQLTVSMKMEPSERAQEYLNKLKGVKMEDEKDRPEIKTPDPVMLTPKVEPAEETNMVVGKKTVKLVGERMGIAILPFENKGASLDLGDIVLDKMITALVTQGRFRVLERAQLEKILAEQQLGASGVIDASTAAEIGKGIGVDAIIIGSVAATQSGSISLDARAIDTESATIIVAHDAYSGSADAQSVRNTVENLANKFVESLPLVDGFVIRINSDNTVMLDVGRVGGMKKGLKCIIYKEGAELKHPITGEILGKDTKIVAQVLVSEVFDKYSTARLLTNNSGDLPSIGDKFLTK